VYRHRQVGYVSLAGAGVGALWTGVLAWRERLTPLWLVAIILLGVAWLFSSLTIEIRAGELRSHFGPGFWRKRVPLAEIADAELAPSRWWEGWGIRHTTRGWLYNVAGTGAVEVRLRSGGRFRLGTDEPDALRDAIRGAIATTPS
jgi:hypothetical protein